MSPKKPAPRGLAAPKHKGYDFEVADAVSGIESLAAKLKLVSKGKDAVVKLLKHLATTLEAIPQDVEALGGAKDSLPAQLLQHATAEQADKDVRLYSALCIVQMMRVYAPDMPYGDEQLKEVFELLLSCWARLADTRATGSFELCRETLQTFADVKFYIPLLDLDDPDLLVRTFATLLQAVTPENLQVLEASVMVVLTGLLEELEQPSQELCDLLLTVLACPAAGAGGPASGKGTAAAPPTLQYSVAAQRLVAQLFTSRDSALRGAVQRQVLYYVRKSLQDDAAAGGPAGPAPGGGRTGKKAALAASRAVTEGAPCDIFSLLHGLHISAPLLLLPVVPELKAQLSCDDEHRRAATAEVVSSLLAAALAAPALSALQQTSSMATGTLGLVTASTGAAVPLAVQYPDLLSELLLRFADQSSALRQQMLARTGQLVAVAAAASPDGALERKVLTAARDRIQDFDEKVRAAACRGLCSLAASAAAGQPPPGIAGAGAGARSAAATAAPAPVLYDNDMVVVLHDVAARLRDLKVMVRRDAASGLLVAWRGACTALQQGALSLPGLVRSAGWIPARLCAEALRDLELRPHFMAQLAAPMSPQQLLLHPHSSHAATGTAAGGGRSSPGLLPASLGQRLGAAVWAALWASYGDAERTAVRKLVALKAQVACELQQLVELRRQLRTATTVDATGAKAEGFREVDARKVKLRLAALCQSLARDVAGSGEAAARGVEQLRSLVESAKDGFLWERLGTLAAPGSSPEALAAARKDALSRLPSGGSKSPAADVITRISYMAQATLLSPSHVAGLLAALNAVSGGGGSSGTVDSEVASAASLAVAVSKSAPALCCAAMPLAVNIVTSDPPRSELVCTTAVRLLRHAARHCPVGGSSAVAPANGGSQDDAIKEPGKQGPEGSDAEDSEKSEEEEEDGEDKARGADRKRAGKARAGATAGNVPDGAARRTRGQEKRRRQENNKAPKEAVKAPDSGAAGGLPVSSAAPNSEMRAALTRALSSLCLGPYRKAAKAAVHAMWIVLGPSEGSTALSALAGQLAGELRAGREALAATPAVVQAMASVGEVAPLAFAEHVDSFCKFIAQNYMLASLKHPLAAGTRRGRGRCSAAAAGAPTLLAGDNTAGAGTGTEWDSPSYGISLKTAAVRALARGCTPDADAATATAVSIPPATTDAVPSYVLELLVPLLSIEDDMAEYGVGGDADRAHLRAGAARALLHLMKRHDALLSPSAYVALALTMQDPIMEVRQHFGEQVRLFLHCSLQLKRRSHLIAKYSALLPLAGMDPRPEHRDSAARTLRELVVLQRVRSQQAALAAVAATSGGGGGGSSRPSLSDQPEFLVAFLLYILAHHPDCPQPPNQGGESMEEDEPVEPEDYRPFQDMLQFALEPLLAAPAQLGGAAAAGGGGSAASVAGVGEALPAVCKLLRSVKLQMKDADETVEPPATRTIRLLADIALAVAKAIVEREMLAAGSTAREGRQRQRSRARDKQGRDQADVAAEVSELARREHPAHAVVPTRLFALADTTETRGLRADGSCLPPGYEVVLNPAIAEMGRRNAAQLAGESTGTGRAVAVRRRSGGGGDGGGDSKGASEDDRTHGDTADGDGAVDGVTQEGQEAEGLGRKESEPLAKRGSRGGAAGRKQPDAAAAVGGKGGEAGAAAKKGRRAEPPARDAGGGARGKAGAAGARPPRASKKPRGGYESLSEGEPSSSSEEEPEEDEEDDDDEGQAVHAEDGAGAAYEHEPKRRGATAAAKNNKASLTAGVKGARQHLPSPAGHQQRQQPADEYDMPSDADDDAAQELEPSRPSPRPRAAGSDRPSPQQAGKRARKQPAKSPQPLPKRRRQQQQPREGRVQAGTKAGLRDEEERDEEEDGAAAFTEDDKENAAWKRPDKPSPARKKARGPEDRQESEPAKRGRPQAVQAAAGSAKAPQRPARGPLGGPRRPASGAQYNFDADDNDGGDSDEEE